MNRRGVEFTVTQTPLDPDIADTAPSESVLTVYDEEHVITYLRLLDADAQGADWREVARTIVPPCQAGVFGFPGEKSDHPFARSDRNVLPVVKSGLGGKRLCSLMIDDRKAILSSVS
jgi:hypothetical protein